MKSTKLARKLKNVPDLTFDEPETQQIELFVQLPIQNLDNFSDGR